MVMNAVKILPLHDTRQTSPHGANARLTHAKFVWDTIIQIHWD